VPTLCFGPFWWLGAQRIWTLPAVEDLFCECVAKTSAMRQETLFKSAKTDVERTKERSHPGLKDKAKEKIDDAADSAREVARDVVNTSKDFANEVGKTIEKGGNRLYNS
jgi:hypothetical protein